jgi:membrane protein
VLLKVFQSAFQHGIGSFAAATAYYSFLFIPSALSAAISLLGLLLGGDEAAPSLAALKGRMPDEAFGFIEHQFHTLTSQPLAALVSSFAVSTLVALWSSLQAAQSLITALNAAYDCREARTRLRYWTAVAAVMATVDVFALMSLILVVLEPIAIDLLPAGGDLRTVLVALRWPAAVVLFGFGLALTYRLAPCRQTPAWRWVSWGAVAALGLWLTVSVLFSLYVSHFANYERIYGSFAGVALLMIWLHASGLAIILGAEINAEIERAAADPERPA